MANDTEPRIKITKNGPYLVSGNVPLEQLSIVSDVTGTATSWQKDKDLPARPMYALCRCGKSSNKPYCDGTHLKSGFDGTEKAPRKPYMEAAEITRGPAVDLADVPDLCAGARFCNAAGGTWELTENSGDPGKRKLAIEQACNCPSGRLTALDKDGKPIEPGFKPSIALVEDPYAKTSGPLWVRGMIPIEASDGTTHHIRNRVTLCRCGKSANKPFCDGSHE